MITSYQTAPDAQLVEAHGLIYVERLHEPEVLEDAERKYPIVCGQCDHFIANKADTAGRCSLTLKVRQSSSLACPGVVVTSPF
ncbi:MAG: hypothetical protein JO235_17625 [Chroococcidiopsidaceae cyanobacterium CP_BM_RX_35]|nr:hypothetical protein [Chroococcidiopsidaceae cyanobacterium CP_BM_RX_35]